MEAKEQRQIAEGLVNGHGVLVYWKFSGTLVLGQTKVPAKTGVQEWSVVLTTQ